MTNSPFFTIVIPTYNRAGFIEKTIRSVLAQDYSKFEILIVDDGSKDNTSEVVDSIKDHRIRYYRKENGERGAARNFGCCLAKGEYVNFIDSDDLIYHNHLSSAVAVITRRNRPPVFHLGYDVKTAEGKLIQTVGRIRNVNAELLHGNVLSCNGVFIEHSVLIQNPFNEDRELASLEDWELWLRLSARFGILHEAVVTSTVIQHNERSVMTGSIGKIEKKVERFTHYVLSDALNKSVFKEKLSIPVASAYSYAALHMALGRAPRRKIAEYLGRAIGRNFREMFRKRFLVILKLIVFR